jgi:hypothetical protein
MTRTVSKLVDELSKLPDDVQEHWAEQWLKDLHDEEAWDESFKNSQDTLAQLADQALKEHQAGKTKAMGFDEL